MNQNAATISSATARCIRSPCLQLCLSRMYVEMKKLLCSRRKVLRSILNTEDWNTMRESILEKLNSSRREMIGLWSWLKCRYTHRVHCTHCTVRAAWTLDLFTLKLWPFSTPKNFTKISWKALKVSICSRFQKIKNDFTFYRYIFWFWWWKII